MRMLRRVRPSPAMVVAAIALLVALAGTSVAAVTLVIPRASVGLLQLKANSVNSSKIVNGSIVKADIKAGQIPAGPAGAAGPAGPAGAAGAAGAAGVASPGYVAEVLAQNNNTATSTTSTSYTNLSNATQAVTVPTGETDKLVVFFSGESACYGGLALHQCQLKITVDGSELSPAAGADGYFDNNDRGEKKTGLFDAKTSGDQASLSIVRISSNLTAGSHTVQVQFAVTDASTAFSLDDWALVVQRIKVS